MLAESCVPVATHRHGCCVLQRALDAATMEQSSLLIAQVCKHALQLMQVRALYSKFVAAAPARECFGVDVAPLVKADKLFDNITVGGFSLTNETPGIRTIIL